MENKPVYVAFCSRKLEKEYDKMEKGNPDERKLHSDIRNLIKVLKLEPFSGENVQKKTWPDDLVKKYNISNLRSLIINKNHKMLYSIKTNEYSIVNIILRWTMDENQGKNLS